MTGRIHCNCYSKLEGCRFPAYGTVLYRTPLNVCFHIDLIRLSVWRVQATPGIIVLGCSDWVMIQESEFWFMACQLLKTFPSVPHIYAIWFVSGCKQWCNIHVWSSSAYGHSTLTYELSCVHRIMDDSTTCCNRLNVLKSCRMLYEWADVTYVQ